MKRKRSDVEKAMRVLEDTDLLSGKLPIEKIRDALKEAGCIDIPTQDEQELDAARELIGIHRDRTVKVGDVQMEFVNLTEKVETEDGGTAETAYYKRYGETRREERVQLLTKVRRHLKATTDKFYRYYDPAIREFGPEFQNMLPFSLPRRLKEVV